jgi:hypothetical protein
MRDKGYFKLKVGMTGAGAIDVSVLSYNKKGKPVASAAHPTSLKAAIGKIIAQLEDAPSKRAPRYDQGMTAKRQSDMVEKGLRDRARRFA